MSLVAALVSGAAGACAVTGINETARQAVDEAPRLDELGMRAVAQGLQAVGVAPPAGPALRATALAGDLAANTLYYSVIGLGGRENAWLAGAALGLIAGLGAVYLPGPLGLGRGPSAGTPARRVMTVAWYTAGGLAAAAVFRALQADELAEQSRRGPAW
jgi:hypothetical protein